MASSLPDVSDLITTVFLLLPGFLSINLIKHLGKLEFTLTDLETTIWSLFGSLIVDAVFVEILLGLNVPVLSISDLQTALLMPSYAVLFLMLSLACGTFPGLILRYVIRLEILPGALWDSIYSRFRQATEKKWVIVYTSDQKEYQGALAGMSKGKNIPHELLLSEPSQLIRNDDGELVGEMDVGKELYFREDDIKRIAFAEDLFRKHGIEPRKPTPGGPNLAQNTTRT